MPPVKRMLQCFISELVYMVPRDRHAGPHWHTHPGIRILIVINKVIGKSIDIDL